MLPYRAGGGIARPGCGDVDLEALQDAFLSGSEKPSAKVTRSKPPAIRTKAGASITPGESLKGGIMKHEALAAPRPMGTTATSKSTPPRQYENGNEKRGRDPMSTPLQAPTGGMVLNAPGVVSSVSEREVRAPAPMKILVDAGGAVGGWGGAGDDGKGRLSISQKGASPGFVGGGFPAVRHRSEMGLVRLGGSGASRRQSGKDPSTSGHADRIATVSEAATSGARSKLQNSRGGIPADIHEENLSRVSSMSPREVEEAQQEIRATLTPADIEMLMRRGRAKAKGRPRVADGADGRAGPSAQASNRPLLATTEEETAAHEGRSEKDTATITESMSPEEKNPVDSIARDSGATAKAAGVLTAGGVMTDNQAAEESQAVPPTLQCDKAPSNGGGFGPAAGVAIENGLGGGRGLAGGPTGAQRAATAAGGIDSEEALAAALLLLPREERAKSSWTLGVGGTEIADEEEGGRGGVDEVARVDLEGVPVVRNAAPGGEGREKEATSSSALYHHGDDPGKAGYTPAELVRLTRSTVAGQRQLALRALAGVLRGRAACIARGEDPPHRRLPEMLSVAIRLCLDDGNPSVVLAAVNALEAFLAPLASEQEDEEEGMQGRSWLDYQAVPLDVRPLCTREEKALLPNSNAINEGDPSAAAAAAAADVDDDDHGQRGDKSAAELARLCYDDPCRGMIEMGLLPKLHGMIRLYGSSLSLSNTNTRAGGGAGARAAAAVGAYSSNPRAALSCLRVAIAIARRAPWAAARVAVEPGLMDAAREAFLEPRDDGALPVDLHDTRTASSSTTSAVILSGRSCVGRYGDVGAAALATGGGSFVRPGRLALLAVRLTRVLIQSDREVSLRVSKGSLLGATKGLLALGQGMRSHRSPLLQATQCEVLELWRACLSYGIDVNSADTVALISRGQGWWPGATIPVPPSTSASLGGRNPAESGTGAATRGGKDDLSSGVMPHGRGRGGGGREDAAEETVGSAPTRAAAHAAGPRARGWRGPGPSVSLYRALHQLTCACVLPPSAESGGGDSKGPKDGAFGIGGDRRDEGREPSANGGTGGPAPVTSLVGGIECDLELWAGVGDMVDSAVEAAVVFLLESCAGNGRATGELIGGGDQSGPAEVGETPDLTLEAAAIHLVACWVERRAVLSRTADRRGPRQLASIAEDSAVLFSSLLASTTLVPAAVSAATAEVTAAATIVSGLDWLSALFRLGLANDKAAPGEARAALMAAPGATAAALSRFLSAPPLAEDAKCQRGEGRAARALTESGGGGFQQRSICRSSACARWLGCRLLASLGNDTDGGRRRQQGYVATGEEDKDGGGGTAWSALRRDCALQALALCGPGDEAVAVGLVEEALPDALASDDGPEAGAPAVLRKIFRGAISDPVALSHASFHLDGRWSSLQSIRACAPSGTSSLLPLPRHWLMLPLASQGGESAAIAAVSACLSVLVVLERERSTYVIATPSSTAYSPPSTGQPGLSDSLPSAVAECGGARPATHRGHRGRSSGFLSPEVKLYYLANACMYGAAVLSGATAETNFGWLLTRYLSQCERGVEARLVEVITGLAGATAPDPSKIIADAASLASQSSLPAASARRRVMAQTASDRARSVREMAAAEDRSGRALLDFVKDLTGSFMADSFGLQCFARVLRMFLRTGFPAAARCIVWKELGAVGLLSLLDPHPPPNTLVTVGGLQAQANDQGAPDDQPANRGPSVDRIVDASDTRNTDAAIAAFANSATSSVPNANSGGCAVGRGEVVEGGDGERWGWARAYLYPPDVDKSIIDEYLTALQHPRFGPAVDGAGGGEAATVAVEEQESVTMTMRSVAIHHLACYFFPPPPSSSSSSKPSVSFSTQSADKNHLDCQSKPVRTSPIGHPATAGNSSSSSSARTKQIGGEAGDDQGEKIQSAHVFPSTSCGADFGRRKRFERLLLLGTGDPARTVGGNSKGIANDSVGEDQQQRGRFARSVAEAVLGHQCGGVHLASAGSSLVLGLGGADGGRRRNSHEQEACRWGPKLGLERRKVVQVYCERGTVRSSGLGDEDVVAWLETEGELDVRDVVDSLRSGLNSCS